MGFFLSPFRFLFELIGFLISAAFVYGLVLIAAFAIIAYGISTMPKVESEVRYEERIVKEFVPVNSERESTLTCERIAGCEVFPNATTDKEYCPTCVTK